MNWKLIYNRNELEIILPKEWIGNYFILGIKWKLFYHWNELEINLQ